MELTTIGNFPASLSVLAVAVTGSKVIFRREDRPDIEIRANNKENWRVDDGGVTQSHVDVSGSISISNVTADVSVIGSGGGCRIERLDSSGGRMFINGHAVIISADGVTIDGKRQKDDPSGAKITVLARLLARNTPKISNGIFEIEALDGDIYLNGRKQVDAEESDPLSKPQAPKTNGPDLLVVAVPSSYRGDLNLTNDGSDKIEFVDSWSGGNVTIRNSGEGEIESNLPFTEIGRFDLEHAGSSDIDLGDVASEVAMLRAIGSGNLTLGALNVAELVDLSAAGSAEVTLRSLSFDKLVATALAESELTVKELVKGRVVELYHPGDNEVDIKEIDCSELTVKQTGEGELEIKKITSDAFTFNQTGSGNTELGPVTCKVATLTNAGEANLDIDKLCAEHLELNQSGEGSTTIDSGFAQTGKVTNRGEGDISLSGRFKHLERSNSGEGDIDLDA